jgi:RNA polymerase sigma-70 factor (ECF subfamily)
MNDRREASTGREFGALIEAIAEKRDRGAFGALFDFYAPRIKTFLMKRGASADVAEDLAQEALLLVWRRASTFDPSKASASTWIFTIARNLRIDQFRREQRMAKNDDIELVDSDEPPRPDELLVTADSSKHVRDALRQLPPDQLRVVELSFFEGKAHGEIASLLELPLGTVKSRLRLAFGRLRSLLGDLT